MNGISIFDIAALNPMIKNNTIAFNPASWLFKILPSTQNSSTITNNSPSTCSKDDSAAKISSRTTPSVVMRHLITDWLVSATQTSSGPISDPSKWQFSSTHFSDYSEKDVQDEDDVYEETVFESVNDEPKGPVEKWSALEKSLYFRTSMNANTDGANSRVVTAVYESLFVTSSSNGRKPVATHDISEFLLVQPTREIIDHLRKSQSKALTQEKPAPSDLIKMLVSVILVSVNPFRW